jgi:hypothetical protein
LSCDNIIPPVHIKANRNQLRETLTWGIRAMRNRKFTFLAALSFILVVTAFAREDRLVNTGTAPAAQGKINTSKDRNGNTEVEVQVKHMATPQSLTPAKQGYMVWVQPRGKNAELLGALRVNSDLAGSLKSSTTYKDFDVLITAEDEAKPATPSSTVILKGTVERR